jgi:hypothetical protein
MTGLPRRTALTPGVLVDAISEHTAGNICGDMVV